MEERKYAVLVNTRMTCKVVEKHENQSMLAFCYEQCKCDMIEAVHPMGLDPRYLFVCDEEFLMKEQTPVLNYIASYLYETHLHGNPICGDVLVMRQGRCDFELMTKEEAEEQARKLRELSVIAMTEVGKKMAPFMVG